MMENSEGAYAAKWERAYLAQSIDAATGRLFRGIIHNLSGVIQVFSLQTELFGMMMGQAVETLNEVRRICPSGESDELIGRLLTLVNKRSAGLAQMQEKVVDSQALLHRALALPDFPANVGSEPYSINSVVRTEVEFLCADPFFKHKVKKNVLLVEDAPGLSLHHVELHQIVNILLENARDALLDIENPQCRVETLLHGNGFEVIVEDNGPGIEPQALARIYESFYSTRENHLGVGLYLAQNLAGKCGGEIRCVSTPGSTRFFLNIPA
ncbi:MAG: sensor histidine kinase [Desulfobulbaceae bacterium]|nr:sensor histidine kinase [Desulfobulbaceae bacterium]